MDRSLIFIGLGANLPSARHGPPPASLQVALRRLTERGVTIGAVSRWYRSAPLPPSSQPYYINGVAAVRSALGPADFLALLHEIEGEFGRVRRAANEARCLDLDLLAYGDLVLGGDRGGVRLPHPRLAERAFVLVPWADLAVDWRHPVSGQTVQAMLAGLPGYQPIERLPPQAGSGKIA